VIVIEVIFEALPGKRRALVDLARRTMMDSRQEHGCVLYRFTSHIDCADRVSLIELWETEIDLRAHFQGDAFKHFFAQLPKIGVPVAHMGWKGHLNFYIPPIEETNG
jgi:quinol monooxygenase YgiN